MVRLRPRHRDVCILPVYLLLTISRYHIEPGIMMETGLDYFLNSNLDEYLLNTLQAKLTCCEGKAKEEIEVVMY